MGYVKTSKTGVLQDVKSKRYTVLLEPTGKYYLSLQVEISEPEKYSLSGKRVGIDVGVADLAILSNGLKYPSFNSSYLETKTKIWQKKYSRRIHLVKLLVLQDRKKQMLCPRILESKPILHKQTN